MLRFVGDRQEDGYSYLLVTFQISIYFCQINGYKTELIVKNKS